MKKAIEWFNDLEEPYKKQAIVNTDPKRLEGMSSSLPNALLSSFMFAETFQGVKYWNDLLKKLEENEKQ